MSRDHAVPDGTPPSPGMSPALSPATSPAVPAELAERLRGTRSLKWTGVDADVAAWVAESDLGTAPEVSDAVLRGLVNAGALERAIALEAARVASRPGCARTWPPPPRTGTPDATAGGRPRSASTRSPTCWRPCG